MFKGFEWYMKYQEDIEKAHSEEMTLNEVKDIKTFFKWFLNI